MANLKNYFKKVTSLDHYLWCIRTFFLFFYGIPFIENKSYWLLFVKSICTKSAANNYIFKVNNKSRRTRCELCSKLTTKTSGRRHCSRSDVFIINFEHVCTYVSMVRMFNLYVCFYSCFWTNICLLGSVGIFRDTIYWNNYYIQTWKIYRIKSLSYRVSPSLTNRINSQLFFIVNAGFKETKIW